MKVEDRFEYTTRDDPSLNYCLWPYDPPAPGEDKFRSINLLHQSFDLAGIDAPAYESVERLRDAIGMWRTVFGVKWAGGRLGWEYYFYDYARREREVSTARVLDALSPLTTCEVHPNDALPYFMFSLDVDRELVTGRRPLDVVHMYVGNVGSDVSSGIAYGVRKDETRLENFYFFFDAASQLDEAASKIACSAFVDATRVDIDQILWPELRHCRGTICVANKQANDCCYFSGIDVHQLLIFLRRVGYPPEIIEFVETNEGQLDHLLYDVGIDYRMEGDEVVILKSGYYGVF